MANVLPLFPTAKSSETLQSAGGGDNSDGMEARVAQLEAHVSHLVADIKDLRETAKDAGKTLVDLRERMTAVETKIDALPTKDYLFGALAKTIGVAVAILTLLSLFQGQLQHLLHLSK